jgi:hypothetical protein
VLRALTGAAVAAALPAAPVQWHASTPVGVPWHGRLIQGVQLPAESRRFFTWDPVLRRSPDRPWRRWGTDRLVRLTLRVVSQYEAAHPDAPRLGIGDLSRPRGGDFGLRYGWPGHISHQNGLDVDVYYPRRDGRERPPSRPAQIDRALAQDLVNRFVRAGAQLVFVGPHTGLTGPRGVVYPLVHHDNHMHVRIGPGVRRWRLLGRSARGRPIRALELGDPLARRKVLVVGCIHGDEAAGISVVRVLERARPPVGIDLWLVSDLNPDGRAAGTRVNAHGVDLNRNFPAGWRRIRPGPQYSGPRPLSEPESRIARSLIRRLRPKVTIWFHQPQAIVRAWGRSIPAARRYARLSRMPFRAIRWPNGTAPNWQNHLGETSFVVELPAGPLSAAAARRHATAILRLAE